MALPGPKQKCHICSEEVTDADYRRELTCSYAGCPGSNDAYHEECITEHLRKHKLPVARLIGYPCPAMLDNGRPCAARITATHHKVPLNQKKKQKRVEAAAAAAAAAAAPKAKPQAQKPKEGKLAAADVAVAAMHPAGVPIGSVATVMPKPAAPTGGSVLKATGVALAVSNNNAMAPERVVRQRQIPGWNGPDKVSKMSNLEQQRAMVAALRAEAKTATSRTGNLAIVSSTGLAVAGLITKEHTGQRGGASASAEERDASDYGSIESDYHRWQPDDSSDCNITEQPEDFNLAQEDFPAFPTAAAITPSRGLATPFGQLQLEAESPSANTTGTQLVSSIAVNSSNASPLHDDVATADPESPAAPPDDDDPNDPIVALDPLWVLLDGTFAVQDAYGNFFPVEEMYGPSVVTKDYMDETGTCRTYVVIRQSLVTAQIAQQEAASVAQVDGFVASEEEVTAAPPAEAVADSGVSGAPLPNEDDAREFTVSDTCSTASQEASGAPAALLIPQQDVVEPEPNDAEGDLDDLLALCMGSPSNASAAAAAAITAGTENLSSYVQAQLHYAVVDQQPALCYGNEFIAAAPAGCADMEQADGEDVGSLLELLCV